MRSPERSARAPARAGMTLHPLAGDGEARVLRRPPDAIRQIAEVRVGRRPGDRELRVPVARKVDEPCETCGRRGESSCSAPFRKTGAESAMRARFAEPASMPAVTGGATTATGNEHSPGRALERPERANDRLGCRVSVELGARSAGHDDHAEAATPRARRSWARRRHRLRSGRARTRARRRTPRAAGAPPRRRSARAGAGSRESARSPRRCARAMSTAPAQSGCDPELVRGERVLLGSPAANATGTAATLVEPGVELGDRLALGQAADVDARDRRALRELAGATRRTRARAAAPSDERAADDERNDRRGPTAPPLRRRLLVA